MLFGQRSECNILIIQVLRVSSGLSRVARANASLLWELESGARPVLAGAGSLEFIPAFLQFSSASYLVLDFHKRHMERFDIPSSRSV